MTTTLVGRRQYARSVGTSTDGVKQDIVWVDDTTYFGDVKVGVSNPRFRDQIAQGRDATTGYRRTFIRFAPGYLSSSEQVKSVLTGKLGERQSFALNYTGSDAPTPWSLDDSSSLVSHATTDFINRARSTQTAMQSGVFIGELGKAISMIRRPADTLLNSMGDYLKYAKKHLRSARTYKEATRRIRDTYLEYTFGWRPLISDVESAAIACAKLREESRAQQRITATNSTYRVIDRQTTSTSGALTLHPLTSRFFTRRLASCRVVGAVALSQKSGRVMPQTLFGLTLSDFLPTVWELLPWSFVVDYFSNVGDLISYYSYDKSSLIWSATSRLSKMDDTLVAVRFSGNAVNATTVHRSVNHGNMSCRRVDFQRTGGLTTPSLELRIPGVRQGFSLTALAHMIGEADAIRVRRFRT